MAVRPVRVDIVLGMGPVRELGQSDSVLENHEHESNQSVTGTHCLNRISRLVSVTASSDWLPTAP